MPPYCSKHNCYYCTLPETGRMGCPDCHAAAAKRARYDQQLSRVLRMGSWLAGPQALSLSPEEWERHFEVYRVALEEVRRLGEELRPVVRPGEPTSELLAEIQELFSA